ncbi:low-specificity L-threonine aldolase [Devosia rhodophyticola]|uniref:Low-specificity L-threonine aldolase n=1 Tax=Devosia rhodophyticola TaxID=3026423 RepID=A0ABY7YV68_9HYPH|nr:low-specificity L-threonine aldolase [Devosia rhodophyticola]WDR05149.1 low-specificity L-threonine aldolase [Devosia rhodophyticola]
MFLKARHMHPIRHDFRSDTVTRPTPAMRAAMAEADVGDDVYGEDPSVNALQERVAAMLGKAAGLFVPSGTQSNLLALMSHCERGDEYIVGQMAHCYRWEAGGAAVLGSIQPQPIAHLADGTMALADIEAAIKSDDMHFARTRLIALENAFGGKALPMSYMEVVAALAHSKGLALHLDGARAFNASVALGVDIAQMVAPFDTVSICLSKGLGAPVGSVLVGARAQIDKARRLRKMLGGGMRQAGILAAGGLYALAHNIDRLAEDHARAKKLALGLDQFAELNVEMPDTNIIFVRTEPDLGERLVAYLGARGIAVGGLYGTQRWVTHLDIDEAAIEAALDAVAGFFARN